MLTSHKNENYAEHLLINLNLERYMDNFINNGYDDLDIIRQIDDSDLDIMLITDTLDRQDIVDTVRLLNEGINRLYGYMEVEPEVLTPSGEDLADPVSLKLQSEGITLSSQCGLFFKDDGYPCTMRDYDLLRARYAQELQVPSQSICEALNILHTKPTKPPKPKAIPVYDSKSGKLLWKNKIVKENKNNYVNVDELIYDPDHNKSPISCTERSPEHRRYEEIAELDHKIQVERRQKDIQHGVSIRKKTLFQKIKTSIIHMRKSNSLETTSSTKTLISDRSSGSFCPSCCGEKSPRPCQVIKDPTTKRSDWQRSNSVPIISTAVSIPPILSPSSTPCTIFSLTTSKRNARKQSADSGNHSWDSNDSRHSQCQSCGPYDIYAHVRWDDVPLSDTSSSGSTSTSVFSSSRTSSLGTAHNNTGYYNSWKTCVQYNSFTGVSKQSCDLNDLESLQGSLKVLLDQIEGLKNNSYN